MDAINKLNQAIYNLPKAQTVLLVASPATNTAIALIPDNQYKFPELPCEVAINEVMKYARYWGYKGGATVLSVIDGKLATNLVEV